MIVSSEIASRALSPSVNDPGTAIAPLGHGSLAHCAAEAMVRCDHSMTFTPDLERVRAIYPEYWGGGA